MMQEQKKPRLMIILPGFVRGPISLLYDDTEKKNVLRLT